MHELIAQCLQADPAATALAQLPLDGGALIAAFAPAGRWGLRWLAKTAYGADACRRLHAEARALRLLAPLAASLHLPQLLGFTEAGAGEQASACLVQSAIAGQPLTCRWRGRASAACPRAMRDVLAWLQRFQVQSASLALPQPSLAELGAAAAAEASEALAAQPELEPLLAWVPKFFAPAGPNLPALCIHGDFWQGNVLWNRRALGVVDWSGFGSGSALDDLLTWVTQMPASRSRSRLSRVQLWPILLFQPGPARQCIAAWAAHADYDAPAARYALYLFLSRRMFWELGLGLQHRSQTERQWARQQWAGVVNWLSASHFPAPLS